MSGRKKEEGRRKKEEGRRKKEGRTRNYSQFPIPNSPFAITKD
ncbi:hypothetical protein [Microcoleus asticus]|nr:hypothetical protein [Microcoleus asticus]